MDNQHKEKAAYEARFWDHHTEEPGRLYRQKWYSEVSKALWRELMQELGDLGGQRVLFVGCGVSGGKAADMARRGADVWCVDISPRSLERLMMHPFGDLRTRIHPVVADAEQMPFIENSFDVVVGTGIVHHLDVDRFMRELRRVCVPGATVAFSEPLGTNPFINCFRRMTPKLRVPTEHPLRPEDIRQIGTYCRELHTHHRECLTMFSFLWFALGLPRLGRFIYRSFGAAEAILFQLIPPTRWLAWVVVIVGYLQKNGSGSGPVQGPCLGQRL